jgi:hypothetical protein
MKTAVEWLVERISHGGLVSKKQFNELLEQAKEMEKQQIIEAIRHTEIDIRGYYNDGDAEFYYNETYNK